MATPDKSFLGTGWSFPPTFSRQALGVQMVSAEDDIRESLWVLLSTSLGERIMVPEYGCQLWELVFHNVTTTLITQLKTLVTQAVLRWEPRIDVNEVTAQADPTVAGLVKINLSYTVRTTNTRSNLVYPFYLREATIPSQVP